MHRRDDCCSSIFGNELLRVELVRAEHAGLNEHEIATSILQGLH